MPSPKRKDGKKNMIPCKARYATAKQMVTRMVQMGYDHSDINQKLVDEFGYTKESANDVIYKTAKEIDKKFEKYADGVVYRNLKKLETLVSETYDKEKYKECMTALDLINKMTNVYTQNVKIDGNGDFNIKIGNK